MNKKFPFDHLIKRGDSFFYKDGYCKVMAVTDGYVMARKKGAWPFLISSDYVCPLVTAAKKRQ